jgi:ABC-type lipopolysaccharide export system ATPase subunit
MRIPGTWPKVDTLRDNIAARLANAVLNTIATKKYLDVLNERIMRELGSVTTVKNQRERLAKLERKYLTIKGDLLAKQRRIWELQAENDRLRGKGGGGGLQP